MSEDESSVQLTRRRALGGAVMAGLASVGAGAGTMALFRDTEESSDNRIEAGTLDLEVSNHGDFDFEVSDVAPGEGSRNSPVVTFTPTLSHVGTVPADHVEIDFANSEQEASTSYSEHDTSPNSADGMATYIEVEELGYQPPDGNEQVYVASGQPTSAGEARGIVDVNGNGWVDLDDLETLSQPGEDALDDFVPPQTASQGGQDADFTLKLGVSPEMGNDYQGDVVATDVTISLHQEPNQDYQIE